MRQQPNNMASEDDYGRNAGSLGSRDSSSDIEPVQRATQQRRVALAMLGALVAASAGVWFARVTDVSDVGQKVTPGQAGNSAPPTGVTLGDFRMMAICSITLVVRLASTIHDADILVPVRCLYCAQTCSHSRRICV
jgi:hypothetical protein